MYAVLETGGKQIKAIPGQSICIEKLPNNSGEKISLKNILLVSSKDGIKVGNPFVKGAFVNAHILEQNKGDKIIVYKMRPKKGTRKKQGHRQFFSKIYIDNIELDGKVIVNAEEAKQKKVQTTENKPSKKKTKKEE